MATTFKADVKRQRKDGLWPVYIRVTHNRKIAFIPTDKTVDAAGMRGGEINDPFVMQHCSTLILNYAKRLNHVDTKNWSVQAVVEYLKNADEDISFSDYARIFHANMINAGQERNARNYELAYQHLERFAGTTQVMFSQLTSFFINHWIDSLKTTNRAKEMYPICIRQIFKSAINEFNDYDNDIIKIRTNPWLKVKIPSADVPEKRAISAEACKAFLTAELPPSKMVRPLEELGQDVANIIFGLAGINTVDLYNMKKADYYDNIFHYKRAKTTKFRADGAYIEMRVPQRIEHLIEKYLAPDGDDRLFVFAKLYVSSDSFNAAVNVGINHLCDYLGVERYCVYTFRHTWATVAQNDCNATIEEVGFALNHSPYFLV